MTLGASNSVPYLPAVAFTRTEAERDDPLLSWERSDQAFFAAGACHVLAFRFMERHRDEGFSVVYVRPVDSNRGHHVYVTDGLWAFDFNGWTLERALLEQTERACRAIHPDWRYERMVIEDGLETFCRRHHHRPPDGYAGDPVARADAYLDRFEDPPPRRG